MTAPLSPMLACQEFLKYIEVNPMLMRPIHRIHFDNEKMLNQSDGSISITSHNFLLITIIGKMRFFFIDTGYVSIPVFLFDGNEVTETPVFR